MPRRDPEEEAPAIVKREDTDIITQKREYQVITPIFGGGVEPMTADPVTVIRGSTIRGQLRFWWRATRGGQFGGSLAEMKKAEDAIFGAAATFDKDGTVKSGPSKFQITVEVLKTRPQQLPFPKYRDQDVDFDHFSSPYSYVAFPLSERPKTVLTYNYMFRLELSYLASAQADFDAALWAWETFGGIGGRTRRGFGALKLLRINSDIYTLPSEGEIEEWIKRQLDKHVKGVEWPENIPHVWPGQNFPFKLSKGGFATSIDCWRDLISTYKQFRQWREMLGSVPGPSGWPEPDAIRQIRGLSPTRPPVIQAFPRAVFGLPIIFQFKASQKRREPDSSTLQSADFDRFASPLLLRPIACANNRYVGAAVILFGPTKPPGELKLYDTASHRELRTVSEKLTSAQAPHITPLNGQEDILWAFVAYYGG